MKTQKPARLFIDQYGGRYWARTVEELRDNIGGGKVSRMYCDGTDGKTYTVGYVIGQLWLSEFMPVRKEVT